VPRLRHAAQPPTPDRSRGSRIRPDGRVAILLPLLAAIGLLATSVGPVASTAGPISRPSTATRATVATAAAPVASAPAAPAAPAAPRTAGQPAAAGGLPLDGLFTSPAARIAAAIAPREDPNTGGTAPAELTPQLSAELTAKLAQLRTKSGIPGIQAAIIFPDGHSWRAHAGFENYAARMPVKNTTPFPVASVSKTFLATLVVQLADDGRFSLDNPLKQYLPAANVDTRVTIRELLDHTSGVYDFFSNSAIDAALLACRTCIWTPQKSLSYVKKPYFTPGKGWAYSNTNYVLLGQLVEAVVGQPYASQLRQRYFDPLGLISTFVQVDEQAPYPVTHSYKFSSSSIHATPQSLWDGTGVSPFRSLATAAGSAGAIASTARDLAVWARALYSGHVLSGQGSKAMLDFSQTMSVHAAIPYGLGVQEFTVVGRTAYGHGGRLLGARSAIRYIPTENLTIAVVMNTDRGDPGSIANQLAALILAPLPPATPAATAGTTTP
jgi:D-alanyl-D-alanine carboxypeptidase